MDPELVLAELRQRDDYEGQLAVHRRMPAHEARFAALGAPLADRVERAMRSAGIERLFTHQAAAVDRLRRRLHTVVATGTASGKTLAYQLPVVEAALARGTTLYIAPTKALAHDQLRQIATFGIEEVRADTYDGDTPQTVRA